VEESNLLIFIISTLLAASAAHAGLILALRALSVVSRSSFQSVLLLPELPLPSSLSVLERSDSLNTTLGCVPIARCSGLRCCDIRM